MSNYRSGYDGGGSTSGTCLTADPVTSRTYDTLVSKTFVKSLNTRGKLLKHIEADCFFFNGFAKGNTLICTHIAKPGPYSSPVQHTDRISKSLSCCSKVSGTVEFYKSSKVCGFLVCYSSKSDIM